MPDRRTHTFKRLQFQFFFCFRGVFGDLVDALPPCTDGANDTTCTRWSSSRLCFFHVSFIRSGGVCAFLSLSVSLFMFHSISDYLPLQSSLAPLQILFAEFNFQLFLGPRGCLVSLDPRSTPTQALHHNLKSFFIVPLALLYDDL